MNEIVTKELVVAPQTANDFKGMVDPDWCPGCGDFGVLNSLRKACANMGLKPHEILTVSGIGCSSNFPGYFTPTACTPCMGGPWPSRRGRRWRITS